MSPRVAVYARYSSDLQDPMSIADQIAEIERLCARNGWTITHTFTDEDMTGKARNRPGFQDLLDVARRGEIDIIVAEAVDRLTRRVSHGLQTYDMLEYRNIKLHTVAEGEQDFMRMMLFSLGAQMYAESVGKHTKRGLKGKLTREKRLSSLAYGYRVLDADTGLNREIDPDQAAVVLRIFEETALGHSAEQICRGLNEDGIPAPRGGKWFPTALRGNKKREEGILRNRIYIGIARYAANTHVTNPEDGSRTVRQTPEERVDVEIPDLRIVPQDIWECAQAELAKRARTDAENPVKARRTKYLLSGLMICDVCGGPYIVVGKARYGCRNHRHGLCDNAATIAQARIETRVFTRLRSAFDTPELMAEFTKALAKERRKLERKNGTADIDRLRRKVAADEKARENIMRAIEAGAPWESFRARSDAIEATIAEATARIRDLEALQASGPARVPQTAEEAWVSAIGRLEILLGDPGVVHAAHQHLAVLIRSIRLRPDACAQDAHTAQILTDLGGLLLAAGAPRLFAERFSGKRQLSAVLGGWPPKIPASARSVQPADIDVVAFALGLEQLEVADQVRELRLAVGPGVEIAHVGLDRLAEQAELIPLAVLVDLLHRLQDQGLRLDRRPLGGLGLGRFPPRDGGRHRLRLFLDDILDHHEAGADVAQGFGRLALADADHVEPLFADPVGERGEIAVGTHQHETVEPAGMQQVHRIDHQPDVRGVLALGIGGLLVGDEAERMDLLRPGLQPRRGPVAIDPPERRFAVAGDFLQDRLGEAGGDVVGVDQDGEQRVRSVSHGLELERPGRARKAAPPGKGSKVDRGHGQQGTEPAPVTPCRSNGRPCRPRPRGPSRRPAPRGCRRWRRPRQRP